MRATLTRTLKALVLSAALVYPSAAFGPGFTRYYLECSRDIIYDAGGLNWNRQNDPSVHRDGLIIHQYQVCREA